MGWTMLKAELYGRWAVFVEWFWHGWRADEQWSLKDATIEIPNLPPPAPAPPANVAPVCDNEFFPAWLNDFLEASRRRQAVEWLMAFPAKLPADLSACFKGAEKPFRL